jgi:hypothetical protein
MPTSPTSPTPKKFQLIGGTTTSEGFIPYLPYEGYLLPVKLDIPGKLPLAEMKAPLPPLRRKGHLVFALPGGGEHVSHLK